MSTAAGRPLRVTVIRSWVCSTRSTISESLALSSASGSVSGMTTILVTYGREFAIARVVARTKNGGVVYPRCVALNIKNAEVERLAEEVARLTGESKTEAVRRALSERKQRLAHRVDPD